MKFTVDDTLELFIQRIAGPVEIISEDGVEYEIRGIPEGKEDEVRDKTRAYIESRGKVFNEID